MNLFEIIFGICHGGGVSSGDGSSGGYNKFDASKNIWELNNGKEVRAEEGHTPKDVSKEVTTEKFASHIQSNKENLMGKEYTQTVQRGSSTIENKVQITGIGKETVKSEVTRTKTYNKTGESKTISQRTEYSRYNNILSNRQSLADKILGEKLVKK